MLSIKKIIRLFIEKEIQRALENMKGGSITLLSKEMQILKLLYRSSLVKLADMENFHITPCCLGYEKKHTHEFLVGAQKLLSLSTATWQYFKYTHFWFCNFISRTMLYRTLHSYIFYREHLWIQKHVCTRIFIAALLEIARD